VAIGCRTGPGAYLDVHDLVVDHVEDEHARPARAEADVSVAGALALPGGGCVEKL
jgi:hypothetical protein